MNDSFVHSSKSSDFVREISPGGRKVHVGKGYVMLLAPDEGVVHHSMGSERRSHLRSLGTDKENGI